MERIENREALGCVRETSKKKIENSRCRILICAGTGCLAGGSGKIYERMCELVKNNPDVEVHFGPEIAHGNEEQPQTKGPGRLALRKADATGSARWAP